MFCKLFMWTVFLKQTYNNNKILMVIIINVFQKLNISIIINYNLEYE